MKIATTTKPKVSFGRMSEVKGINFRQNRFVLYCVKK